MHLVFLDVDTHHCHFDFKRLDENDNVVIPQTLALQLNAMSIYDNENSKIYPDLNPTTTQETQGFFLEKLTEN